jgi:hypothetical protein
MEWYEDCTQDQWDAAKDWLKKELRLEDEEKATFPLMNAKRERAVEFIRFYLAHKHLKDWYRWFAATLAVDAAVERIDPPEREDGEEHLLEPLHDEAEFNALLVELARDEIAWKYMGNSFRKDMEDFAKYGYLAGARFKEAGRLAGRDV